MPRHVYKTEPDAIFFQKSKPEIDGNPAPFLFREPVRVNASTSADLPWSMCPAVPTITLFNWLDMDEWRFVCIGARRAVPAYRVLAQSNQPGACDATGEKTQGSNFRNRQEQSMQGETSLYLAAAISSTMSWAAARGSSAARIGLPTTRKSAPALMASVGVAVRA